MPSPARPDVAPPPAGADQPSPSADPVLADLAGATGRPVRRLTPAERRRDLAVRDLTDPAAGGHAVQLVLGEIVSAIAVAAAPAPPVVRVERGPVVVPLADNYDVLGFSPAAVTRDARYTRYVGADTVLRTHTSALVPPALRRLAAEGPAAPDDVVLVCPGIVYRRDALDRLHTGTPHQLDLWRLRRNTPGRADPLAEGDLEALIGAVVGAALPGVRHRTVPAAHPYTTQGRQIDALVGDGPNERWVEVGECGLAHPDVLARCGIDPSAWSSLALGVGLDRLVMLRKGIDDIRLLRSQDPRVVAQLGDLSRYRPVSACPAIGRDLSVAVAADTVVEDLGDRVRAALGDEADLVEEVRLVELTPGERLPAVARRRLGLRAGQANALVRVVLRRLDRALTRAEANRLRDAAWVALHEGDGPMPG